MELNKLMNVLFCKYLQCRSIIYKHNVLIVKATIELRETLNRFGIQLYAAIEKSRSPFDSTNSEDSAGNIDESMASLNLCPLSENVNSALNVIICKLSQNIDKLLIEEDNGEEPDANVVKQCLENIIELATDMLDKNCYGTDAIGPMKDVMNELRTAVQEFKDSIYETGIKNED